MPKPQPPKSHHHKDKPYHHGDLRQSLLEAGLKIVREEGREAVTLRGVARRAGVSHAAPYHHFPDKAALMEALAAEAFGRFTRILRATWRQSPSPPLAGLAALGEAYINFALDYPEEFRLMHLPDLRRFGEGESSPVSMAAGEAHRVLREAVEACQQAGQIPQGDPDPYALTAWSGVHGLAVLLLDGLLVENCRSREEGTKLAQTLLHTLAEGLKPRPDQPPPAHTHPQGNR